MKNKFLGRKLTLEEIKLLADGTKVWVEEREESSFENQITVKNGDKLEECSEIVSYYIIDETLFDDYGCKAVYEVCLLDEMQPITFNQARELKDGTKVFAIDESWGEYQWTTKIKTKLKCFDGTGYTISNCDDNDYAGREIKLYVDKSIKFKDGDDVVKEFKVGDRVKAIGIMESFKKAFGEVGTVVEVLGNKVTVNFDNDVEGWSDESLNIANGHGLFIDANKLEIVEDANDLSIKRTGNKISVTFNGVSAEASCYPDDDFVMSYGVGLALTRLGEKLMGIGEEEIAKMKEEELPVMTKEDFRDFLDGKVVVNCTTEEDATEFVKMCYALGVKWGNREMPEGTTLFDGYMERTCYRIDDWDDNLVYCSKDFYKDNGYKIVKFK